MCIIYVLCLYLYNMEIRMKPKKTIGQIFSKKLKGQITWQDLTIRSSISEMWKIFVNLTSVLKAANVLQKTRQKWQILPFAVFFHHGKSAYGLERDKEANALWPDDAWLQPVQRRPKSERVDARGSGYSFMRTLMADHRSVKRADWRGTHFVTWKDRMNGGESVSLESFKLKEADIHTASSVFELELCLSAMLVLLF